MFATVTYPYRDRETYEIHRTGDTVELTPERFAELSASGYVDAASPIDPMERADGVPEEPEGDVAEPAKADAPEPPPAHKQPQPPPAPPPAQERAPRHVPHAAAAKARLPPNPAHRAHPPDLPGAR